MNRNNKTASKTAKIWQRHTLAQACFMVAAGVSTAAWAVDPQDVSQTGSGVAARATYTNFGAPFTDDSQGLFWSTGYNNQIGGYQYGSGPVTVTFGSLSSYQQTSTGPGAVPVAINDNSFLSYSYANQQTLARSLSLLNRTSIDDDGQLALNLQVLSAPDALTTSATSIMSSITGGSSIYIDQTGSASANLSLSGNTFSAAAVSNLMETTLAGALPFLYDSGFKGQSSLTYTTDAYFGAGVGLAGAVDPDFFRGTRAGVNITNIQSTFNTAGMAVIEDANATITVSGTPPATPPAYGVLADSINLNSNNILAKSTINSATSVVQASASSSAFSGSIAVTNGQNNYNTNTNLTQTASVDNGDVLANVQGSTSETRISGSLNVNGNTVSATATGNAAGARTSTGTIAAGNAIVFDGNADIRGPIGSQSWTETLTSARKSLIYSDQSDNNADLLINSAQRNLGIKFLANVNPSEISSTADNLAGGAISQNGNTQSATVSGNLVGNLITAGTSASIGNILSNAAIVSSQENKVGTSTATVEDAVQKVSVGLSDAAAINGTISLNDNQMLATAEGNAAASSISLKASTLSVGQGMGSVQLMTPNAVDGSETEYWGSSYAAASVLSAQKNTALTLTSNLENSSISAEVKIPAGAALSVTGSQISVNGNSLLSSATGNAATNSLTLTASTAASLNAGVGNTQFNSGNEAITSGSDTEFVGTNIVANAGNTNALSVSFSAKDVLAASQVSLNTNTIGATAKGSSATNTLSVTADNASGADATKLFGENSPTSQANDPNTFSSVKTYADFGMANAQAARGTKASSVVAGSVTGTVVAVDNASVTANSNSVSAVASLNSASNSVALNIGNMSGMSAALSSAQTAANSDTTESTNAKATAQTTGAVSLTTTGAVTAGSSLTLSGNTVSASASANNVSNALSLTGTTASGRDSNWTLGGEEEIFNIAGASINADGSARGDADFSLANKQKVVSSAADTATVREYSAQTTAAVKAVVGGALTDASVTVTGNSTLARSSGNDASNTITLAVNDLSKPNTALASMQTMDTATFTAKVTDTDITLGTGISISGAATNAQVAVTNNLVKATAVGNVVTNSVALSGGNLTGSTTAFLDPVVSASVLNIDEEAIRSQPSMKSQVTVALVNMQTSTGNAMSAKLAINTVTVDDEDIDYAAKIGISNTGAVSGASTLSVTGNSMATQVYNNSANNSLGLNYSTANQVSAGLVSAQLVEAVSGTTLDATTNARIQIESGAVSGASSLTSRLNEIKSTAVANIAGNSLTVNASTASGRNTAVDGYLPANAANVVSAAGFAHEASADYAIVNEQIVSGSVLGATTNGNLLAMSTGNVTNSNITLSDNTASSYASANNATNALQLEVTNLSAARAGLTNAQMVSSAATVTTATTADATVSAGNLFGAKLSANSNQITSTSLGNTATNTVSLAGTTASSTSTFGDVATRTGSASDVNADMALASSQANSGSTLSATLTGSNIITVGTVANDSANLSVITANSNSLTATSTVNNVSNTVGLNLQNSLTGMAAGLSNSQTSDESEARATVTGEVRAVANAVSGNSSLSVNSNTISASATANTATNTVNVAASTASGRNSYSGNRTALTGSSFAEVTADYALANMQSVTTGIAIEFKSSTEAVTQVSASDVGSSSVAVNSNSTLASTLGNSATNNLNVAVTDLTLANTGLVSKQTLGDTVSFTAEVNKTTDGQAIGITASVLRGAQLTANNNTLKASAIGNSATNSIFQEVTNATGAEITTSFRNSVDTANASVGAPGNVALSSLQQSTGNAITATLGDSASDPTVQPMVSVVSGNVNGASQLSLTGNTLSTQVFNNSANNSVALSGTNLTSITAGLASGQSVTAVSSTALTATTNATAAISVQVVDTGALLTASTNTLKSLVVGNSAGNALTVTATNASGQNFDGTTVQVGSDSRSRADFALASQQVLNGSAMEAKTLGVVSIGASGNVTGSSLTANDNTVSAYTSANNVTNALNLNIGTLTDARAGLANEQSLSGAATVKATVEGAAVRIVSGGDLSAVQASLAGNTVKATALGNVADNLLALTGTNATAGTQAGQEFYAGSLSTVDSGLGLVNKQASSDQTVTAKNGTGDSSTEIALNAGLVQNASALALTGNTVSALSYANNASNGLGISVSNLNGLTAGVSNTQTATASATQAVSAETYGKVVADLGTVQGGSTLTLSNNTVSATSMANYASNALVVAAQQITGKGGFYGTMETGGNLPGTGSFGDLTLSSSQSLAGSGDAVTTTVAGSIYADPSDLTSSSLTVSSNTIAGYAAGNNVGNSLVVNTTGLNGAVVALGNAQKSVVNAISTTTGFISSFGETVNGAQVAVNDNQVKSTAVGNVAGNTLTVIAANATGVSGSPSNDLTQSTAAVMSADVSLANVQNLQGSVTANTGNLGDQSAMVTIAIGTEAMGTSTLSLNGNAVTASAYGNSATNAGVLRISNALSAGSAVGNAQYATGSNVTAEVMNGKIFGDAYPLTDTNMSVNSNRITSSALVNTATNTLAVSAASATGRNGSTSISATGLANADQTVGNFQKISAGSVSSTTGGEVLNNTWAGNVTGSIVSQNANAVTSYASANQASNGLNVAVSNLNTGTAGLYSGQTVESGTTVQAYTSGTVLFTTQDEGTGNIASSTVSLNDNLVKSSAFANTATNELLVSGATLQSQVIATNVTAGLSATSAHVGMVNSQTAKGAALTAKTQATDTEPFTVQLSAGTVTSSALSLNANTLAAQAINNSANNTLGMSVTNTVGTSIALANGQEATSDAGATTRGKVWADVSDLTGGSIAVNSNDINAKAYSNTATNTLTVAGTNYTGSGLNFRSSAGIAGAGPSVFGEIAMTNAQFASANTTEATTVGGMTLATGSLSSGSNTLSMNNNAVTAYASGNAGSNTLGVTQTALNGASAGLVSTQNLDTSDVTASTTGTLEVTTAAVGNAEPVVAANVTVKDNSIKSTALGNVVGNAMVVSATTATNAGPSDVQTSASTAGRASATADYSMANAQGAVGDMSATTTGTVSVSATSVANSSLSMTGNAIKSVAQANSATNELTLTVAQPTAITAAVASRQDNDGAVSASTTTGTGALSISASSLTQSTDQSLSVVMSGNTVSAAAGKNEAFNTLAVSGTNVQGRNNDVSDALVGTASVTGVDYSVVNAQTATGGVSASVDVKASGIASSGTVNAGTITLSDNTVSASANANTAGNTLTLAATNRLEASGAINNVQNVSTSAITATVESASLTVGTSSGEGSAKVTSTGNVVKATASANMATNALNATASNGITTAGAERGTGMDAPQTPTFAVLNSQHTNAASSVSSVINGFSMGGSQLSGALNGGSAAVTGNVIQSVAYGNSASNSIQVSALPATLNTASASITNVQYNLASVTSTIAGVNVQANGTNSVSSSGVNISGNTVMAMAVGNRAVNTITGR